MKIYTSLAFLILILGSSNLSAQTYLGNYQSSKQVGNILTITAAKGTINIQTYTAKMIKVSLVATGVQSPDTSYSVIGTSTYNNPVFSDNGSYITFSTDSVTVWVQKNPVRLKFIFNNDTTLEDYNGLFNSSQQSGVSFTIKPSEQIYGSGSRAIPINRRGQVLDLYNTADYGYGYNTSTTNINIPLIISSGLYGLYFDNYSEGTLDIASTKSNVLSYTSASGKFSYYFIAGNSFGDILSSYTSLTGRQPLPPRWVMGYIQSKYGYKSESAAQTIVSQMTQAGFPMDAIVLDLYWYGSSSLMGNLDWDYSTFPTPQTMMHSFDSMGIKTILIAEPYVTQQSSNYSTLNSQQLFATNSSNQTYVLPSFWAGSAALLDIYKPTTQSWLWSYYKARTDEGVGGWWSDLGEPEDHPSDMIHVLGPAPTVHNIYNLFWQQMLYNNFNSVYPGTRLFNLSRSGYAGMQRYAATPWSGDVQSSFSGLQAQIPVMLGMSMSGESYSHSDLGGFTGPSENDELYTRWFEYCTFVPIMRAHGGGAAPTEPVNYPLSVQATLHIYANLRYQLVPYNYSLAFQNSQTGYPQAKQLNFYNPSDTALGGINDEYYWGDNFLVAPVIQQGATSRTVIFPPGTWINYWNNSVNAGNSTATISAPLNIIPLFVRSGSFIPMAPFKLSTSLYKADSFFVKYYADTLNPVSSFTMYDDDGVTPNANLLNKYALVQFDGNVIQNETDINLSQSGSGYTGMPAQRQMIFEVQRSTRVPVDVLLNGVSVPVTYSLTTFSSDDSAYFLDDTSNVLYVHFKWNESSTLVQIIYSPTTGINTIADNEMKIYPNPVSDILTLQSNNCNTTGTNDVFIYDMSGRTLIHSETTGGNSCRQDIDVSALAQGTYLLEMKSNEGIYYSKFVKQ